ncbi:erythritol transport system substrate-binding protein [Rhodobacter sp. JA431]|uniref:D-ribose ABC transporter substrate-binding protein n=1 Tax=Rhodobacter sp. JA431 TaxID=570013 RepID=UPI000BC38EC6|nr:D-ribose ABC transporter substrate-binding protein [Rhodobacter sp. JA431]SOC00329.1 erythritol transport system substrate-binding protein [Rhodobacter sp. JA431]
MRQFFFASVLACAAVFAAPVRAVEISIIVNEPSNEFWFEEGELAKRYARKLGYDVRVFAHSGDLTTETALLQRAVESGSAAILLDPAHLENSASAVDEVVARGVPVFVLNAKLNSASVTAQFLSDNEACGRLAAQQFVTEMQGAGTFVQLDGPDSDLNSQLRRQGFESVLPEYPKLQRLKAMSAGWDRQTAFRKVSALLETGAHFDGVLSANDTMALGAIDALANYDRAQFVIIGGFDGTFEAQERITRGDMSYTIAQPLEQITQNAVDMMDRLLKGEELPKVEAPFLFPCHVIGGGATG